MEANKWFSEAKMEEIRRKAQENIGRSGSRRSRSSLEDEVRNDNNIQSITLYSLGSPAGPKFCLSFLFFMSIVALGMNIYIFNAAQDLVKAFQQWEVLLSTKPPPLPCCLEAAGCSFNGICGANTCGNESSWDGFICHNACAIDVIGVCTQGSCNTTGFGSCWENSNCPTIQTEMEYQVACNSNNTCEYSIHASNSTQCLGYVSNSQECMHWYFLEKDNSTECVYNYIE